MDKRPGSPSGTGFRSKKQRSESPASRKVGIVCHSMAEEEWGPYEVKLYVIDIDDVGLQLCEKYVPAVPVVRFHFPRRRSNMAVCVINFTVYLFGGYNSGNCDNTPEKSAYKFVLSEDILDHHVKAPDQLSLISNMSKAKGFPVAIRTPNRTKIIVFGTYLHVQEDLFNAFELYDPVFDTWKPLPALPSPLDGEKYIEVTSYSFVDESHFLVNTNTGSFVLDLEKKAAWVTIDIPPLHIQGYFATAKGRYAIIPRGMAYDFGDERLLSGTEPWEKLSYGLRFPLSIFDPPNTPEWLLHFASPYMVPLEPIIQGQGEADDGEFCHTCFLQLETIEFEDKNESRVLIDVFRTQLKTLITQVSKSVSLRIDYLECPRAITLISI